MKVYVLSKTGKPLMPTTPARARKMLRDGKAMVVRRTPFAVQMTVETKEYVQPITLGIDAGSKTIGVSASTENGELYSAEVTLRNDIVGLLSDKRQYRRARRNRLRYRQPRFNNRKKTKGWLAPSVQHKVDSHLKVVDDVHKMLPISKIVVEVAAFDIQKIKNPSISGKDYQRGEQMNFWNVREYVLFRDKHVCQHCKGKSKNPILNVHHLESRKTGGDAPNNLVTLCKICHDKYHKSNIELKVKRGASFRDAAFMGIMRWAFYNKLKEQYPNVHMTFGYITKNVRIENRLSKEHRIDAFCITGRPTVKQSNVWYRQKFVRKNNRSLYKANLLKGGRRKANKAEREVYGFRLFDKVKYDGVECFVFGRRKSGYFDLRLLDGTNIHVSASYKKLKLLEVSNNLLIERTRGDFSSTLKGSGFLT